jgi:hypothetical protein
MTLILFTDGSIQRAVPFVGSYQQCMIRLDHRTGNKYKQGWVFQESQRMRMHCSACTLEVASGTRVVLRTPRTRSRLAPSLRLQEILIPT